MTREHHRILDSWLRSLRCAIEMGDADAGYRLTLGLVRRLREIGVL
jgi:hypothetical protein